MQSFICQLVFFREGDVTCAAASSRYLAILSLNSFAPGAFGLSSIHFRMKIGFRVVGLSVITPYTPD